MIYGSRAAVVVLAAVALLGCSKATPSKPCTPGGVLPGNPDWTAHPGLVAPGGNMCLMTDRLAGLDYAASDDRWANILDHLEKQGFTRGEAGGLHATLTKGSVELVIDGTQRGSYLRVSYQYRTH